MTRIVPVTFADAAAFVAEHHRHHAAPIGHKFSIGLADGDELVGVAMVGRPVARHYDDGLTLEVNRTCVADGVLNGNSQLYGAAWRAAGESGSSLRAAGWRVVAERPARRGWDVPSRRRHKRGTENVQRTLWEAFSFDVAAAGGA